MTSDVSKLMVSFRIQHDLHVSQRLIFILVLMIRRDLQLMIQCKNDMDRRTVRKTARCQKRYSQWNGIFTEIKHKDIKWAFFQLFYHILCFCIHVISQLNCVAIWSDGAKRYHDDVIDKNVLTFFPSFQPSKTQLSVSLFSIWAKKFYLYASTGKAQENTNSFKKVWRTTADSNFVQIRCKEI